MGDQVDRSQKIIMRQRLEQLLELQQDLGRLLEACAQEIEAAEYRRFLEEMKQRNKETIQTVKNYMVRKCNR